MKTVTILAAVAFAYCNAEVCHLLTNDSFTKDWFSLEFDPPAGPAKVQKIIYGNGWVSSRKNENELDDKKSFKGLKETSQKITVSAKDGTDWKLKVMSIKSTNVDDMIMKGIDASGGSVFERTKTPRDMARFEKWEFTKLSRKEEMINKLEITAAIHEHEDAGIPNAEHHVWLRGLKVEACQED